MSHRSLETRSQIMQAALVLLKESGVEGLTMRKVAAASGRSLNNVQHHFTNKDYLLECMAKFYFDICDDIAEQYVPCQEAQDPKSQLYDVILYSLNHADQINDACLVVRELWAISTRNKDVETQLIHYYSAYFDKVCAVLEPFSRENAKKATSILLPYIDGYSIQHKSLPLSKEEIAQVLTDSLFSILIQDSEH